MTIRFVEEKFDLLVGAGLLEKTAEGVILQLFGDVFQSPEMVGWAIWGGYGRRTVHFFAIQAV